MNLSLLQYVGLKTSDLTPAIVAEIAKAFGHSIDIDDAGTKGLIGLLQNNQVHELADILGKPELIEKFRTFLKPIKTTDDGNLIQCPHCQEFLLDGANK